MNRKQTRDNLDGGVLPVILPPIIAAVASLIPTVVELIIKATSKPSGKGFDEIIPEDLIRKMDEEISGSGIETMLPTILPAVIADIASLAGPVIDLISNLAKPKGRGFEVSNEDLAKIRRMRR